MQDFIGSVRRSLVFKPSGGGDDGVRFGGFVEKIGSSIRRSRIGLFSKPAVPALPPIGRGEAARIKKDDAPAIRWRRGELIGCGAFGRVYMGMNIDSGELLAVKQVSIAANSASKEKTQAHIRELEEEVKLLKNLSHPNIVRYLGTAREEESLNILLEFVPGGSISSLLGKFGSFPESVIRMYTKQLLLGLEYLHKNGIMHRDIKGANILVDNKGCIKLADFGASKKVVELATITGAKSMKGTPYWMAPEVILQTGHSFSADVWSVGCTVIEMATGKPPWSQQYQEVAALFHIGTTKSHPPIPEHLSFEAKDFLLKCLQKEPDLRATAADLLQHPFVTGEHQETNPVLRVSIMEHSGKWTAMPQFELKSSTTHVRLNDTHNRVICSTIYPDKVSGSSALWGSCNYDDDMCQIDDKDNLMVGVSAKFDSPLLSGDLNKSFNPMSEPIDWPCKFDESPELEKSRVNLFSCQTIDNNTKGFVTSSNMENEFTFPSGPLAAEDDDEVTESKIRAFLDEKALDLKKLQTPLYKEYYNSVNAAGSPIGFGTENKENFASNLNLPPKSRSPKRMPSRRLSAAIGVAYTAGSANHCQDVSNNGAENVQTFSQVLPCRPSEWEEGILDPQQELISSSASFSERQRRWEQELYEELERKREMMRLAGVAKASSPKDRTLLRQQDRSRLASPGK
ncbi:LOW QUALITY PROTEIN: mitogen-activated protein kinase kinase kinase NPK1-like [Diospyros lotus]|uniref:LOW QUALITY PROTEIN: mitogen-activated protein kinase kinase kinase NPK1-like n=1 Tax=Diospyros lotus TaxID=55363 RepID=UPI002258F677|nr:LOW QUALITY PROTEIN: mitogen-activated protein kinase kinase kinase NPK1-like [Diospyros lotus]